MQCKKIPSLEGVTAAAPVPDMITIFSTACIFVHDVSVYFDDRSRNETYKIGIQ
jgi:hypothetical protein